jgi:hypothetical protein
MIDFGGRPRLRSLFLPSAILPAILPSSPRMRRNPLLEGTEWHVAFYFCNNFISLFLLCFE